MSVAQNLPIENEKSWVFRLPSQLACFLLAFCLLWSQLNPCDATSVSLGSSLTFILLTMGVGCLVAIDAVLTPNRSESSKLHLGAVIALVLLGAWLWICTAMVPGKGNARFATNGCWQWIAQMVLAIATANLCFRYRVGPAILALMLGCASGTVAIAFYQYFVSMPALRKMFAANPNAFFEKMDVVAGSAQAMQLTNRLGSLEPTGPFALTNSLAGLMTTWLVFILVLLGGQATSRFLEGRRETRNRALLPLGIGLAIAFFLTLLLTKSRSAWLAAFLMLLGACLIHPSLRQGGLSFANRFRTAVISIALVISTVVGVALVRDPMIVAEAGKSLSYRLDYWRGAITLINAEPWCGYGVANFQQNYNRIKSVTASESPADPHNFILETATAGGLPLLAVLIGILLILIWKTIDLGRAPILSLSPFAAQASSQNTPQTTSPNSKQRYCDLVMLLGAGCGCGWLLFLELIAGEPDSIGTCFLFLGVSLTVGWSIFRGGLIHDSRDNSIAGLIALASMLLHLLASGGWMQPGMMNSVCILGGIAFATDSRPRVEMSNHRSNQPFRLSVAYLLLVMAGTVNFATTMCLPVLASSGVKSLAASNPISMQDASEWMEIIKVDPLDPELPSIAAKQMIGLLSQGNLSDSAKQKYCVVFDACCREYLARDANNWVPLMECGRWNTMLADIGAMPTEGSTGLSRMEISHQYFAKSADLYPNSAQTQLQAAVSAAWCQKLEEAKRYADKAEEIDRETMHADRKLNAIVVFFPRKLQKINASATDATPLGQSGLYQGEPILRWLRNNVR